MNWLALRMLTGDKSKYLSLILSITFATLLMSQQVSIFMGVVERSASQIIDVRDADLWVMDSKVRYIDEAPFLPNNDLQRVRGVPGVEWAVRFHKSSATARLPDGNFRNVMLLGVDDATMVGSPRRMVLGELSDLNRANAVFIDKAGYEYMWPGEPFQLGREFHINDRRVVLMGICKASPPFTTLPILYSRFTEVERFFPTNRNLMNYVLAKAMPGQDPQQVCQAIEQQCGLMALTQDGFFWKTIDYFMSSTGIPINFGITIGLGFIVGAAVAGQTFYLFTLENLKQFGALKAMGVTNARLISMILLQASAVSGIGYGLGMGTTAIFFTFTNRIAPMAGIHLNLVAAIGVGLAVVIIILLTSLFSLRKVLFLEPAVVFRG
ncbi:ABC transporter permease [Schlesneria sp. T3-172]|uniref:ABC transporter permease n=1 Tax=Schlesneria sphaerica TaxID=3373610 RepID=UPI0037C941B2